MAARNLAPLHAVGIMTMDDLVKAGSVEAYHRIQKAHGKKLRVSHLYAFEGAITGRYWFDVSKEEKAAIRAKAGLPA